MEVFNIKRDREAQMLRLPKSMNIYNIYDALGVVT